MKKSANDFEEVLQRSIIDTLNRAGMWAVRTASSKRRRGGGAFTGEPGFPDVWTPWIFLEVKLPGKDLDPEQVRWHAKAKDFGVKVAVVRSVIEAYRTVRGARENS